jgi:hypothetical protein
MSEPERDATSDPAKRPRRKPGPNKGSKRNEEVTIEVEIRRTKRTPQAQAAFREFVEIVMERFLKDD